MSVPRAGALRTAARAARTPDPYVSFCEGVRALCSIDLAQYRRGQMERRIRTFAERQGEPDLLRYLETLRADPAAVTAFLDRVTINVSQLWRNPDQWLVLRREVLPGLLAEGRLRAWSAGCSYGAEAYTLAAVCAEAAPGTPVAVQGTDIDGRMVARAREGRFSAEDARDAPRALLARHFVEEDGGWRAGPALRAACRFERGDLLRMAAPRAVYDLVLCRNTVIYFNEDARDALHERLAASLRPGGHLLIGSTERVARPQALGLEPVRPFLYRRS